MHSTKTNQVDGLGLVYFGVFGLGGFCLLQLRIVFVCVFVFVFS